MKDIGELTDLMVELLENNVDIETVSFTERGREIVNEISDFSEKTRIFKGNEEKGKFFDGSTSKQIDYSSTHRIRVDYMQFKPINHSPGGIEKGSFYCYEIKSCKEDFESGHGLNFVGDFNYLVLPKGLYKELKIPYGVGVYEPSDERCKTLKCVKKAQQVTRERSVAEMLLMMFRSANRKLIKR